MKKVKYRQPKTQIFFLAIAFLLSFSTFSFAQDEAAAEQTAAEAPAGGGADIEAGKAIFNTNCAACHKLYANSIGPALHGITEQRDREWLYKWIQNSTALIASGDKTAVAVFEENDQKVMPPFPQLSEEDIDNILAYVSQPKPEPAALTSEADKAAEAGAGGGGVSNHIILAILAFVLLMLLVILVLVNKTLRRFAEASGVEIPVAEKTKRKPIWKAFAENQFLVVVTAIVLLLAGGYFIYGYLMQVGIDKGYKPVQPIHFSHRIHAGENQIDCKFCHSSARLSKTSGIPSLNVCMNCHKSIGEVAVETATEEHSKEFYDSEIAKLYEAVGWDPAAQEYTGETQPVKWVRIHNLPDFAYFNHSQHVTVAGVECQKCHGPVEEMEVMYQHAPLTMKWCVECHRETNVDIVDNPYYEKVHEALSEKYGVEELTVAEMGGIECGKCHY